MKSETKNKAGCIRIADSGHSFIYGVIINQQLCCGASQKKKKTASFGRGTKPVR